MEDTMVIILQWEIGLLLAALALIIFCQILGARINTRGLLQEKDDKGQLSWGRVQLLVFTIIFALLYLFQVSHHPTKLPEFPLAWLLALGGSHLVYLGEKTYKLLIRNSPQ
jgi:uncharacterized BrkB/YihY/UPF0761 family membrane protein